MLRRLAGRVYWWLHHRWRDVVCRHRDFAWQDGWWPGGWCVACDGLVNERRHLFVTSAEWWSHEPKGDAP